MKVFLYPTVFIFLCLPFWGNAQTIGSFTSVDPTTNQAADLNLEIPNTHTFQVLKKRANAMGADNYDFTGYIPISGSSENGYISLNHETSPGGVSILDVNFNNTTNLWQLTNTRTVNFTPVVATATNCSGAVTSWGTSISGEEGSTTADANADGYNDRGWLVQINPVTNAVMDNDGDGNPDKLWAAGCFNHENAVTSADGSVLYEGADEGTTGYVYKFVPTTPRDLSSGELFVLKLNVGTLPFSSLGAWVKVPNATKPERNNTRAAAQGLAATNFNGVEDVEIGPDGKIYFTAKGTDRVYRFKDNGTTVSEFEILIDNVPYNINFGTGNRNVTFQDPDNLAFDGEGNLWILQDGGNNYVWVITPSHTTATPSIRIFANTPSGSEATGITFSPDYRFMFVSLQHPNPNNLLPQIDATNSAVMMDDDMTLVIARKEFLGSQSALPIELVNLNLEEEFGKPVLSWQTANESNASSFVVERAGLEGKFTAIGQVKATGSNSTYSFTDNKPMLGTSLYRLKMVDLDQKMDYSNIVSIVPSVGRSDFKEFPNPFSDVINIDYNAAENESIKVTIWGFKGKQQRNFGLEAQKGMNSFQFPTTDLPAGIYVISIINGRQVESRKIVKQ